MGESAVEKEGAGSASEEEKCTEWVFQISTSSLSLISPYMWNQIKTGKKWKVGVITHAVTHLTQRPWRYFNFMTFCIVVEYSILTSQFFSPTWSLSGSLFSICLHTFMMTEVSLTLNNKRCFNNEQITLDVAILSVIVRSRCVKHCIPPVMIIIKWIFRRLIRIPLYP